MATGTKAAIASTQPVFPGEVQKIQLDRCVGSVPDAETFVLVFLRTGRRDVRSLEDVHPIGIEVETVQQIEDRQSGELLMLEGQQRVRVTKISNDEGELRVDTQSIQALSPGPAVRALAAQLLTLSQDYMAVMDDIPWDVLAPVMTEEQPDELSNLMGSYLPISSDDKLGLIQEMDLSIRLDSLIHLMNQCMIDTQMDREIDTQLESRVESERYQALLRAKLRAIQQELGESNHELDTAKYLERIAALDLPESAQADLEKEVRKLQRLNPGSEEAGNIQNYIELLLTLPWKTDQRSELDIKKVGEVLNKRHYGLGEVKQRILEYLAVRKVSLQAVPQVLCLVGPPGVGKTSIVRSVANALGRPYGRIALGGIRDEADLRGHRRTYVGAFPGKIISAIYKSHANNPVILLDEIDKMGAGFKGDPASVLLEILDPEQNDHFVDHYLQVPFDLSNVLFVCTANSKKEIPGPLRDRLEVLDVPGYGIPEKVELARDYLFPDLCEQYQVRPQISDEDLKFLIVHYTKDVGLRGLRRTLDTLFRKIVFANATDAAQIHRLSKEVLKDNLGPGLPKPSFSKDPAIGRSVALYSDGVTGNILPIEAVSVPGNSRIMVTGNIVPLLKETISTSMSNLKRAYKDFGLKKNWMDPIDLHIHFGKPEVEKRGEGWGLAVFAAMLSNLRGIPLSPTLAFAGQLSLLGKVLPTSDIEAKCLAASQLGIEAVVISAWDDQAPIEQLSQHLEIIPIRNITELLPILKERAK